MDALRVVSSEMLEESKSKKAARRRDWFAFISVTLDNASPYLFRWKPLEAILLVLGFHAYYYTSIDRDRRYARPQVLVDYVNLLPTLLLSSCEFFLCCNFPADFLGSSFPLLARSRYVVRWRMCPLNRIAINRKIP